MTNQREWYVRLHQDDETPSDEYVYSEPAAPRSARARAEVVGGMGFGRAELMVRDRGANLIVAQYYRGVRRIIDPALFGECATPMRGNGG